MKQKDAEFQSFINKMTEIKNESYEEFIRFKYLVDGVLLSKKTHAETCNKDTCGN